MSVRAYTFQRTLQSVGLAMLMAASAVIWNSQEKARDEIATISKQVAVAIAEMRAMQAQVAKNETAILKGTDDRFRRADADVLFGMINANMNSLADRVRTLENERQDRRTGETK